MSQTPNIGSLSGVWTYRSFLNDPDLSTPYDSYLFGSGYITVQDAPMDVFKGVIGDTGWSLDLNGSNQLRLPVRRALSRQGRCQRRRVDLRLSGLRHSRLAERRQPGARHGWHYRPHHSPFRWWTRYGRTCGSHGLVDRRLERSSPQIGWRSRFMNRPLVALALALVGQLYAPIAAAAQAAARLRRRPDWWTLRDSAGRARGRKCRNDTRRATPAQ